MAQQVYSKALTTTAGGAASGTVAIEGALGAGLLHAVYVSLGTLDTPDITITDTLTGAAILTLTGVASSARYQPRAAVHDASGNAIANVYSAAPIGGSVTVTIAGGGATLTGTVYLYIER